MVGLSRDALRFYEKKGTVRAAAPICKKVFCSGLSCPLKWAACEEALPGRALTEQTLYSNNMTFKEGVKVEQEFHTHEFEPVYDNNSRVLILGSFPSVKSRAEGFYYGHPQNRFWKVLAAVFKQPLPVTVEEKKAFLLKNGIALWDVLESCEITGSSDSSIKKECPVDIMRILAVSPVKEVYTNGGTAKKMYDKYLREITGKEAGVLPSTSPANAAFSLERLVECWGKLVAAAMP